MAIRARVKANPPNKYGIGDFKFRRPPPEEYKDDGDGGGDE